MQGLSKDILSGIIKWGYHIDAPGFLNDGRLAGQSTRMAYKEILLSNLGIRLHEGEDEEGNTLMIFIPTDQAVEEVKMSLSSSQRTFPVSISKYLTESEMYNLYISDTQKLGREVINKLSK